MKKTIKNKKTNFIKKAIAKHGYKYDYSKVNYINNYTAICIICPIHGNFYQKPTIHLSGKNGCNCPKCAKKKLSFVKLSNTKDFIKKAQNKHEDLYDYSKVNYINKNTKVCIICHIHGEFFQKAQIHLMGSGCQKCWKERFILLQRNTKDIFILNAKKTHGEKYNYSKVNYITSYHKVSIICPTHGEFSQKPGAHLAGQGCPKCHGLILKDGTHCSSYAEAYYYLLLKERNIDFKFNKVYDIKWGKFRYDFYIPKENKYIEITSFNKENSPSREKWKKYLNNIDKKRKYVEENLKSNFEFIQIKINTKIKHWVLDYVLSF
jgi:hypothetical protein